jgi:hypothetical protein
MTTVDRDEVETAFRNYWSLGAVGESWDEWHAVQPPIDFPGVTVLRYAGDAMFSLEEDFWSLPEGIETAKRSAAA